MDNLEDYEEKYVLIFDTGDGRNGTITKILWNVFEYKTHQKGLCEYQDKIKVKFHPIVNAVTKAWVKDIYIPVFLVMNYSTLIDDKE